MFLKFDVIPDALYCNFLFVTIIDANTSFFNFTAWRELAENIVSTMSKGMRVVATGRMEQKDWTDKDGNKRTSYDLVLDEIGPSLRWATAVVTKVDKNGSSHSSPSVVAASAAFNATVVEEDPF